MRGSVHTSTCGGTWREGTPGTSSPSWGWPGAGTTGATMTTGGYWRQPGPGRRRTRTSYTTAGDTRRPRQGCSGGCAAAAGSGDAGGVRVTLAVPVRAGAVGSTARAGHRLPALSGYGDDGGYYGGYYGGGYCYGGYWLRCLPLFRQRDC